MERISSRKFIFLLLLWVSSLVVAFVNPDFVGDAQTLYNFWIFLAGLYFSANVGEKIVNNNSKK